MYHIFSIVLLCLLSLYIVSFCLINSTITESMQVMGLVEAWHVLDGVMVLTARYTPGNVIGLCFVSCQSTSCSRKTFQNTGCSSTFEPIFHLSCN
eukprot:m.152423 g.152423  ORF g.152423 m.152423 type:complete len:95 (+) comp14260_c0_seq9:51-335(+)